MKHEPLETTGKFLWKGDKNADPNLPMIAPWWLEWPLFTALTPNRIPGAVRGVFWVEYNSFKEAMDDFHNALRRN